MGFADKYFQRFNCNTKIFNDNPRSNTGIIVVIPCYDDEFIFNTLASLEITKQNKSNVEVIVIVNSSELTSEQIIEKNQTIFAELIEKSKSSYYKRFQLYPHLIENVPRKHAGVGNARKIGMDEALQRFNYHNNEQGIIVSLDADSLVSENYFIEIEKNLKNDKTGLAIFQFQHDFNNCLYSSDVISACRLYEIYLRYFRQALKYSGFPYSIHTIGSCFAVKATVYAKAGGMSRRQGGEDFYFLHKTVMQTKYIEIPEVIVYPSPRLSDRVPFGTGPAVGQIIESGDYKVYNFELFKILKEFFSCFVEFYYAENSNLSEIPIEILNFYGQNKMLEIIQECKNNTSGEQAFIKRMFTKFDAFQIVKFLNSFENSEAYPTMDVIDAVTELLMKSEVVLNADKDVDNLYQSIFKFDIY